MFTSYPGLFLRILSVAVGARGGCSMDLVRAAIYASSSKQRTQSVTRSIDLMGFFNPLGRGEPSFEPKPMAMGP